MALSAGLAATLFVAACHLFHVDRGLELRALDLRFRHLSSPPPCKDLVIVAIDDRSLSPEKLGRWPWPRETLAGVIDVLRECGARAVALDIMEPEPQKTRHVAPADDLYDPDTAPLIGTAPPRAVFDDAIFERAMRAGRVLLPMHIDFGLRDLGKDEAMDANVRKVLASDPMASFEDVRRVAVPDWAPGKKTPELEEAATAYWRNRALDSLKRFVVPRENVTGYPAGTSMLFPPLFRFASACRRSGFVTFQPESDGIVRRIRLLASCRGDVYPQFALALAVEAMAGEKPTEIHADASHVTIGLAGGQQRVIPVDDNGRMLINWASTGGFRRIPAHSVGFVWQLRQRRDRNRQYKRILSAALARRLNQHDLGSLLVQADGLYKKRQEYERTSQRALLYDPRNVPSPPVGLDEEESKVESRIEELSGELLGDLDFYVGSLPKDDPNRVAVERMAAKCTQLTAENEQRRRDIAEELAKVRKVVEGKICIVGSTSSGAADFVPTPVYPRMPGVEVHANIFNTIASGAFVAETHPAIDVVVILLAGAAVTLLGARLPVFQAGPLALALAAAYAAVNLLVVFAWLDRWLVLVAPIAGMVAAFLVVTACRQFTEEREKRRIRGEFAHALSPVLVDQLLADPTQLNPKRQTLSCFFSDLAKFTPLAERLGEQGTIALLRRYLDRMDDIIQIRCGGFVSKYMGDGILSFFGAPVPQEDHARRALAAAVACVEDLVGLNEEISGQLDGRAGLSCRVGIATGPVMFGDCGSTNRPDYTAIGDCVNLASRLESANKQFGTLILADEDAWKQGDDGSLLARRLGRIIVVGKSEPVGVWNVLCRAEDASDELRKGVESFAAGVALFERRDFAGAAEAFEAAQRHMPDDGACAFHLALCRKHIADPPPDDWDGAIQLTEK